MILQPWIYECLEHESAMVVWCFSCGSQQKIGERQSLVLPPTHLLGDHRFRHSAVEKMSRGPVALSANIATYGHHWNGGGEPVFFRLKDLGVLEPSPFCPEGSGLLQVISFLHDQLLPKPAGCQLRALKPWFLRDSTWCNQQKHGDITWSSKHG